MSEGYLIPAPLGDISGIYEAMIAASPDAVTMTDLEGRIIYVSPQTLALHGYDSPSQLLGRSAFELIAAEDRPRAYENMRLTAEQGQVNGLEYTLLRKDGQRFIAELNTALIKNKQGQPQAFLAFSRDISERKRAEEALRLSEKRYRTLLESVTDYTYTVEVEDGRPKRTRHGPNCVAVTGYSPEDYAANPLLWHAMIHQDDKERVAEHAEGLLQGRAVSIEHRIIHKDGSVRWVKNTPVLRFDKQGRLVSYDGTVTDITERKNSEEAVRESREHYRLLVELSPDGVMVHCRGRIVFINDRGAKILGAEEPKELVGKAVLDLVPPGSRDEVKKRIDEMYLRQVSYPPMEQRITRVDGGEVEVELTPAGFIYQGEPAVLAIFRDISERKRTSEALRASEELNRAITQQSPLGISVRDQYGRLISCNQAWQKIWVMSDEEVRRDMETERTELKLDDRDSYLGPWADQVVSIYKQGGVLRIPELRILKPTFEEERYISQHFYALKSSSGFVERVVIITEDITERKKAEQAMRASEERHRLLLNGIRLPVLALKENMEIYYCNQAYADMVGETVASLEGRVLTELFPLFTKTKSYQACLECLRTGDTQQVEDEYRGRCLHVWVYKTDNGILAVGEDVTEMKKAEEILRRDVETFQRMVEQKTAELMEVQQRMQRAEQLSDLGRMAVQVAHELRNPLGVIRLATFNIGRKRATTDIRRHIRNIEQKIVESEKIINNLLGFARIQAPQWEKVELDKILRDCAADIRSRYPKVRVRCRLKDIRGISLKADAGQMREVFQNTLENAAQAVADGRGGIEIQAEQQKAGIAVYIRDEGTGVATGDLSKIFKPFFTTKPRGIGLGLSIAKELVALHHGDITIKNRDKGGAEVRVWIPDLQKEKR